MYLCYTYGFPAAGALNTSESGEQMGSGGELEQEVHRDCVRSVSRQIKTHLKAHITEMIEWREMIAEQ